MYQISNAELHIIEFNETLILQWFLNNVIHEHIEIQDNTLNSIYVARVDKIVKGLFCAFVDIGQSKNAFLPLDEKSSFQEKNTTTLKQGDKVLVQIKKEAYAEKGATLTRDIKIPGEYLMYMPFNNYIATSSNTTDKQAIARLKKIGIKLSGGKFGILFRKNAENANYSALKKELEQQIQIYNNFSKNYVFLKTPTLVYKQENSLVHWVNEYKKLGVNFNIVCNSERLMNILHMNSTENVTLDIQLSVLPASMPDRFLTNEGVEIVVDHCEALTVFDINSSNSKFNATQNAFLNINLNASEEIVRFIKLKNISGIIIVDFINMQNDEEYQILLQHIQNLFAFDRTPGIIHGFTKTGLLEITRKRN